MQACTIRSGRAVYIVFPIPVSVKQDPGEKREQSQMMRASYNHDELKLCFNDNVYTHTQPSIWIPGLESGLAPFTCEANPGRI